MYGCVLLLKPALDLQVLVPLLVPLLHLVTLLDLALNLLKFLLTAFDLLLELLPPMQGITLLTGFLVK